MNIEKETFDKLIELGWTPPEKPEKQKKYELSEYGFTLHTNLKVSEDNRPWGYTSAGATRKTKESAQIAMNRLRRTMHLSALAAELEGEREFGEEPVLYSMLKDNKGKWRSMVTTTFYPETVYMTGECADDICCMLNKMEFEL